MHEKTGLSPNGEGPVLIFEKWDLF